MITPEVIAELRRLLKNAESAVGPTDDAWLARFAFNETCRVHLPALLDEVERLRAAADVCDQYIADSDAAVERLLDHIDRKYVDLDHPSDNALKLHEDLLDRARALRAVTA